MGAMRCPTGWRPRLSDSAPGQMLPVPNSGVMEAYPREHTATGRDGGLREPIVLYLTCRERELGGI